MILHLAVLVVPLCSGWNSQRSKDHGWLNPPQIDFYISSCRPARFDLFGFRIPREIIHFHTSVGSRVRGIEVLIAFNSRGEYETRPRPGTTWRIGFTLIAYEQTILLLDRYDYNVCCHFHHLCIHYPLLLSQWESLKEKILKALRLPSSPTIFERSALSNNQLLMTKFGRILR